MTVLLLSLEGWGGLENVASLLSVPGDWLLSLLYKTFDSFWLWAESKERDIEAKITETGQRWSCRNRAFVPFPSARKCAGWSIIYNLNLGWQDLHVSLRGFKFKLQLGECCCWFPLISLTLSGYITLLFHFPNEPWQPQRHEYKFETFPLLKHSLMYQLDINGCGCYSNGFQKDVSLIKIVPQNTNSCKCHLSMWHREGKGSIGYNQPPIRRSSCWMVSREKRAGMGSLLDSKWSGISLKPTWTYRSFLKKPNENGSLAMANAGHVIKRSWRKKLSRTRNIRQRLLSPRSKCCHREQSRNVTAEPSERAWMLRGCGAARSVALAVMCSGAVRQQGRTLSKMFTSAFPTLLSCCLVLYNSGVKCSKGGNSFIIIIYFIFFLIIILACIFTIAPWNHSYIIMTNHIF